MLEAQPDGCCRFAHPGNTRELAAVLGSRTARIFSLTQDDASVREALIAVDGASLDLFESLTRQKGAEASREAAFRAIDDLATELSRWREFKAPKQESEGADLGRAGLRPKR